MEQMKVLLRNQGKPDMEDAKAYIATGGYDGLKRALEMDGAEIIEELKKSGLRGRGGAGFPTWLKLKFAFDTESAEKYIVCNADEGEPGTNKDRVLMSCDPHSLLEGMVIAGRAIGAHVGYIYLRAEYPQVRPILQRAIDSAYTCHALGKHIFGSDFEFDISIRSGAGAYVCGEETALFESIEGKRGEPRYKPPFPGVHGLFGKPTALNNVETLANISHIFRNGAIWFAGIGTKGSTGTKLFTVAGNVAHRGVYEFPMGINLKALIYENCGGIADGKGLLAVQTGGSSGPFIRPDQIDIPLDIDFVAASGGRLGCGTVFVIDDSNCILDIVRNTQDFFAYESCGQCTPCREGTIRVAQIVDKICRGDGSMVDVRALQELIDMLRVAPLCGLGHSSAVPIASVLQNFMPEVEKHLDGDACVWCNTQKGGRS
ncbi:MAG: NADH-quinone oxidoreductase subunit NuoF [Oscillospiraceae bacterium]|nr:NADH-quinone oxidoreductase subunit NuoF [Oscillospiraceae bacterium]